MRVDGSFNLEGVEMLDAGGAYREGVKMLNAGRAYHEGVKTLNVAGVN
jgi:hypothetical protein